MMLVILAEFDRRQRADLGKNKCKYFFAIEGAGTEPRPFRKGKAKMTRQRLRRNADRNENSVKCRMHIDTESRVFLQNPHRRHMHEINPICMPGNERQKSYSHHVLPYRLDRDFSANRLSYHGKRNRKPCLRWQPLKTIALTSPYEAFACVCAKYRFKKSCVRFCLG